MAGRLLTIALLFAAFFAVASALTVHIVPHTHDDVGWLKTVDQYYVGLHQEIQDAAVQHIITSVVAALKRTPERKFIYVEQAFFQRWWRQQNADVRSTVRSLVSSGQLEFINGGWCMHDEAATHFVDMIDQTTLGHHFIVDEFGAEHVPTIGWQIDPFGHSATQAALLSAGVGFDGLFFGRIDYQDRANRLIRKELEVVWSASPTYGPSNYVFAGAMDGYGPPGGLCWNHGCGTPPIQDDPRLEDNNVAETVNRIVRAALRQAAETRGDLATMNIMWTMGSDFEYENAEEWFLNLDRAIKAVNANGSITMQYSTPSLYLKAKNAENVQWPTKTDDYFPYADGTNNYWTGYFTSRPALKGYVRTSSNFLQIVRHFEVFTGADGSASEPFWESQSVAQHHDGVSGTAKQAVTFDYAQRIAKTAAAADAFLETAIAGVVSKSGQGDLSFAYCPLANVSYCNATAAGGNIAAVVYNPLARALGSHTTGRVQMPIRVPVSSAAYSVLGADSAALSYQIVQVMPTQAQPSDAAKYEAVFYMDLPGLGLNTAFLQSGSSSSSGSEKAEEAAPMDVKTDSNGAVTIENDVYKLYFDASSGLISSIDYKVDGSSHPFTQDWAWYPSYQGDGQDSGAYIFRPAQQYATPLTTASNPAKITGTVSGSVVSQVWQQVTPWLVQKISLYSFGPYIEFEWTVGPVPVDDGQGKEIIIRFNQSDIASNGSWVTDSNGREMQTRIRNFRPTWKWSPTQPVAGNYYPVNAGQALWDDKASMVVLNDRSQGGASMADGSLEFMVHRRMLKDDGRGVGEPLSEPGLDGKGLIITGRHIVTLWPQSTDLADPAGRILQSLLFSAPHVAYAPLAGSISDYAASHHTNLTFLGSELPWNVELITAQQQSDGTTLIRLAHSFGQGEDDALSQPATVDLSSLFLQPVSSVSELSLSAAYPAGSHRTLQWNTTGNGRIGQRGRGERERRVWGAGGLLLNTTVTLQPLEIRTFAVSF